MFKLEHTEWPHKQELPKLKLHYSFVLILCMLIYVPKYNKKDLQQKQLLDAVYFNRRHAIPPWSAVAWPSSSVQALICTDYDDDRKQLFQWKVLLQEAV